MDELDPKYWTKQKKTIAGIGILLVVIVIIVVPSVLLSSKNINKDLVHENDSIDLRSVPPSHIQQLKCSSTSVLGEVNEEFFFETKSCGITDSNHTISKGAWYTFVGTGSFVNISICVAQMRIFSNDFEECIPFQQDEQEDDCSNVQISTEYDKTYHFFIDFPEDINGMTAFLFKLQCADNIPSTQPLVPAPTASPRPTNYLSNIPSSVPTFFMEKCFPTICSWQDVANTLEGDNDGDFAGGSIDDHLSNSVVALDASGTIVAFGAEMADGKNGVNSGVVKIYRLIPSKTSWVQMGQPLEGDHNDHNFGTAIALSSDGLIIAIGAPNFGIDKNGELTKTGHTRVLQYNETSGMWEQKGDDIDVGNLQEMTGFDVSLNSLGTILAVGSRAVSNKTGRVRVFEWNKIKGSWNQIGDDIDGEQTDSSDGRSVSLSSDGSIIAVGGPHYDVAGEKDNGRVRVLKFTSGAWEPMGDTMIGNPNSIFGFSVDLSSNGMVVAVGARWDSEEGRIRSGSASVYDFDETTNIWKPRLQLTGNTFEQFGVSVKLSSDGMKLAVGAIGSKASSLLPWRGGNFVKLYEYFSDATEPSEWLDKGNPIFGDLGARPGESIDISDSGETIAVGAALATNENNVKSGNVRILDFTRIHGIEDPRQNFEPRTAPIPSN